MSKGKIVIDETRCKGCGLCIWACPKQSIRLADEADLRGICPACKEEDSECTGCGFCAIICPDVAIEVYKEKK